MSQPLPEKLTKEKPVNEGLEVPNTTGPIAPLKMKKDRPLKRSHHKQRAAPTISSSETPLADPIPEEVPGVQVAVENQADPSAEKGGGLIGLLKQAKSRASINEDDSGPDETPKRSHHGPNESTGRRPGRPSKEDNKEEFVTLVFTILTIVISFAGLPVEVRPEDAELKSLAYNIGSILARHLPDIGKLSPDLLDIMGITGTLALYYQRVAPALKQLQAERAGLKSPVMAAKNPNGHKPNTPVEELGPADPIGNASAGAGEFLNHVHKGGKNG